MKTKVYPLAFKCKQGRQINANQNLSSGQRPLPTALKTVSIKPIQGTFVRPIQSSPCPPPVQNIFLCLFLPFLLHASNVIEWRNSQNLHLIISQIPLDHFPSLTWLNLLLVIPLLWYPINISVMIMQIFQDLWLWKSALVEFCYHM